MAVSSDVTTATASRDETYEIGEDTYLLVIDALRRLTDARLREAELLAETRRADAELERAVGARLEATHAP